MGEGTILAGVALQYGRWGRPTDRCHALMARAGCFNHTISPIELRLDHDERWALASTASDTLRVWSDDKGLYFRAELRPRTAGRLVPLIRSEGLRYASVRFGDARVSAHHDHGEEVIQADLVEVSLVADPAQDGTGLWLLDEDPDHLPPDVQDARALWLKSGRPSR